MQTFNFPLGWGFGIGFHVAKAGGDLLCSRGLVPIPPAFILLALRHGCEPSCLTLKPFLVQLRNEAKCREPDLLRLNQTHILQKCSSISGFL